MPSDFGWRIGSALPRRVDGRLTNWAKQTVVAIIVTLVLVTFSRFQRRKSGARERKVKLDASGENPTRIYSTLLVSVISLHRRGGGDTKCLPTEIIVASQLHNEQRPLPARPR